MVKEYSITIRSQAVGMLQAGSDQKFVSLKLGVNVRTVQRWWRLFRNDLSLENKGGRGRKSSVPKVAKTVITKSIGKKRHSVRNLSRKLKLKGHSVSYSSVAIFDKRKGRKILQTPAATVINREKQGREAKTL